MARRSTSRSTKRQAATSIDRSTERQAATSIDRSTDDDAIVVGVVRGPHGVRGEIRVEPLTDLFEERFREGSVLECEGVGPLTVAGVRGTADAPIVRFAGYEDRTAAERLRNRQLRVGREQSRRAVQGSRRAAQGSRRAAERSLRAVEGSGLGVAGSRGAVGEAYLWDDLIGMEVETPDGAKLGSVREVLRAGETDVLVVRDGPRETLLPALASVIKDVDRSRRRIVAVPQEEG